LLGSRFCEILPGKLTDLQVVPREHMTKRKEMSLMPTESEEFASSLLNIAPIAIVVINPDTSIMYVNPALEKLTDFRSSELIGVKAPYPWWPKETQAKIYRDLSRALCEGLNREEELFKRRNGELFWVEITSVPVQRNEELKYYLSVWVDITKQKQLRDNMRFYISEITKAQEEERKRIARELHDETAQSLTSLYNKIDYLLAREQLSEEAVRRLTDLRLVVDKILSGVRRFSHELRPTLLDQFGLIPSLELLVEEKSTEGNIECSVEVVGQERRLSPQEDLGLFRIVQEALNNVIKHSRATQAVVRIDFTREAVKICVCVTDNGCSFRVPKSLNNPTDAGKLGLVGMAERARLLSGTLRVESKRGRGTAITVEVPG